MPPLTTINPQPRENESKVVALIRDLPDAKQGDPARVVLAPELICTGRAFWRGAGKGGAFAHGTGL